ncbi:hypothetical protein amb1230 [Paramagnetospirillum magneticum AMB-1]|uniref:NERD domain-containing protein n=1 Tax=Paramagnetospirillum magneticum (strain ATCC 700264 / AMB-1) TaxID=342108 RepID=Q2W7Z1_PARM1|nr:hypothetical protein amb1230 [Paramagnetospirillum magneticum AMB-1]
MHSPARIVGGRATVANVVPDRVDGFGGRRLDAKRRVWAELRDQLPDDCTVFAFPGRSDGSLPDFVVLGPRGLVHMAVTGGILDILSPPAPGVVWTHRGDDGYFIGAYPADALQHAADALETRLLLSLPAGSLRPEEWGRGLLHVLPDNTPGHTPGIDLASAERRVLVSSDLRRLGEWVMRAMNDNPSSTKALPVDLRVEMELALSAMAAPNARRPNKSAGRTGWLATAGLAAILLIALVSEQVGSGPSLPRGKEIEAQEVRAVFTVPAFIPAKAEWAVMSAIEVAWDAPGRKVKWQHGDLNGTVEQLPRDGRICRAFRISLEWGDSTQSEDRRHCR